MSITIRCLAMVLLFGTALLLQGQDSTSTSKTQSSEPPAKLSYHYAMDPITGTYRLYESTSNTLPTLRTTDSNPGLGVYSARFGDQWFQVYPTTGLSADGRTLFIQLWLEKETTAAKFDPDTGVPLQPRKMGIQEVIREISTEKSKMKFFDGEGKALNKEEAGKMLKASKLVVLISGNKPVARVFSVFSKTSVIAVMEPPAAMTAPFLFGP